MNVAARTRATLGLTVASGALAAASSNLGVALVGLATGLATATLLWVLPRHAARSGLAGIAALTLLSLFIEAGLDHLAAWVAAGALAFTLDSTLGGPLSTHVRWSQAWLWPIGLGLALVTLWLWPTSHGALYGPDGVAAATLLLAAIGAALAILLTDRGDDGSPAATHGGADGHDDHKGADSR
ncbi:MAG: hypothetical protein ACPGQL_03845 [Thermoplasmatota archaeon]